MFGSKTRKEEKAAERARQEQERIRREQEQKAIEQEKLEREKNQLLELDEKAILVELLLAVRSLGEKVGAFERHQDKTTRDIADIKSDVSMIANQVSLIWLNSN